MKCRAIPYEGKEPYIFFSYCHEDSEAVYPLIERLAGQGFRVWYDDGIHLGDDWPDVIADHLLKCSVCISTITEAFDNSHNCRNELTFAVDHKIPRIVIVAGDLSLSVGMQLILSSSQFVKGYRFSDEALFQKLVQATQINVCKGQTPLLRTELEEIEIPVKETKPQLYLSPESKSNPEPEPMLLPGFERRPEHAPKSESEPAFLPESKQKPESDAKSNDLPEEEAEDEKTILLEQKDDIFENLIPAVLIREQDEVFFRSMRDLIRIGRNVKNDIRIEKKTVSSIHAEIVKNGKDYYLRDLSSVNGTFLNGERLPENDDRLLNPGDHLSFAKERYLFASSGFAAGILTDRCYFQLVCAETGETVILTDDHFVLGRNNPWRSGALSDKRTSHVHGTIYVTGKECVFVSSEKKTANGTYIDERKIAPSEEIALNRDCEIRIGSFYHIRFQIIKVREVNE